MQLRSRHFVQTFREEETSSQVDSAALFRDIRSSVIPELLHINGGGVEGAQDKVLHIYRGLWEKQIMRQVVRGVLQIIRTEFDGNIEFSSTEVLHSTHAESLIFGPAIEFVRKKLGDVLVADLEPVETRFRKEVESIVEDITSSVAIEQSHGHTIGTPRIGESEPERPKAPEMFVIQLPFCPRIIFSPAAFSPRRISSHFFSGSK